MNKRREQFWDTAVADTTTTEDTGFFLADTAKLQNTYTDLMKIIERNTEGISWEDE